MPTRLPAMLLALTLIGATVPSAPAQTSTPPGASTLTSPATASTASLQPDDLRIWLAALDGAGSTSADDAARRTAARHLISAEFPDADAALIAALGRFDSPAVVTAVCQALRDSDPAPRDTFFDPLLDSYLACPDALAHLIADTLAAYPTDHVARLDDRARRPDATDGERVRLLRAAARFIDLPSIALLIPWLDESNSPAIRDAAHAALIEITGRADLPDGIAPWQMWYGSHRDRGRDALLQARIHRLESDLDRASARADVAERDRSQQIGELVAWMERVHALTDPTLRAPLLVTFLAHPLREARDLGLSLVERGIRNAEPVDPAVSTAVADLVSDTQPTTRLRAIRLLGLVDAPRASALIAPMLATESDPGVREAMLNVLTARPAIDAFDTLLVILQTDPAARSAATNALLSACRDGLVDSPHQQRLAEILLAAPAAACTPSEAELLAWLPASAPALDRAVDVLNTRPSPAHILCVARGFAESGSRDSALFAASANPDVFPFGVDALIRRDATPDGLHRILSWTIDDPAVSQSGIDRFVNALPIARLMEADAILAASSRFDSAARIAFLSRAVDAGRTPRLNPSEANDTVRAAIAIHIAELRLARNELVAAGVSLDTAATLGGDTSRIAHLRDVLRVVAGPIDGIGADAPVAAWIDALATVLAWSPADLDRARTIAARIQTLWGDTLDGPDGSRLDLLLETLSQLVGPGPPASPRASAPTADASSPAAAPPDDG